MRTRISGLRPGEYARILWTEGDDALAGRLRALGFVRGTVIFCERLSPFGDPMLLCLRDFRVALRRTEGERILVEMGETYENDCISGQSELRKIRVI